MDVNVESCAHFSKRDDYIDGNDAVGDDYFDDDDGAAAMLLKFLKDFVIILGIDFKSSFPFFLCKLLLFVNTVFVLDFGIFSELCIWVSFLFWFHYFIKVMDFTYYL